MIHSLRLWVERAVVEECNEQTEKLNGFKLGRHWACIVGIKEYSEDLKSAPTSTLDTPRIVESFGESQFAFYMCIRMYVFYKQSHKEEIWSLDTLSLLYQRNVTRLFESVASMQSRTHIMLVTIFKTQQSWKKKIKKK